MSKILIAEDDLITAKIIERHLQEWGYGVFIEKNGEDAWETLEQENIQIAILDWMMPKMDGLQLCQKVRASRSDPYTYLILLTARASTADIVEGLNAGADDYITKPVEPAELRARLMTGIRIIELENKNKRLQIKLEKLAREDSLTGFLNKKNIHERLEEELSRGLREQQPISAVLLDIDRFKQINDTYGHNVGDEVLLEIAGRLRENVRRHDHIGRYGGDEILVLLWHTSTEHLRIVADRLCTCISRDPIPTDAGPLKVTVSVGGASSEDHFNISAEDMIKVADLALYDAKHQGRDRVEIRDIL
ncbi:MAG: diguanylate cyclase [Candidatus Aminicenantaceae bacterium]